MEYGLGVCDQGGSLYLSDLDVLVKLAGFEHGFHAEAVNVVPEGLLVRDIFGVREGCNSQGDVGRDHEARGFEIAALGPEDRFEHAFKEKAVAHPFGDNDVDRTDANIELFNVTVEDTIGLVSL